MHGRGGEGVEWDLLGFVGLGVYGGNGRVLFSQSNVSDIERFPVVSIIRVESRAKGDGLTFSFCKFCFLYECFGIISARGLYLLALWLSRFFAVDSMCI